jgi:hypothetical protein
VAGTGTPWATPRWQQYEKHRPPNVIGWRELVAETGKPGGEAYYHGSVSRIEQQEMEMGCIEPARLFRQLRNKRMYYADIGRRIGASDGENTNFLYVEWLISGEVHGRPITVAELKRKGAAI